MHSVDISFSLFSVVGGGWGGGGVRKGITADIQECWTRSRCQLEYYKTPVLRPVTECGERRRTVEPSCVG